ncbi:MAG: hypothetical protein ABMB14_16645 [Myxococcota bacterium]
MTIGHAVLTVALLALVAVPVTSWWALRSRRYAIHAVVGLSLGYLVVGNLLSWLLIGVIYPAEPGGVELVELARLWALHGAVSMGTALAIVAGAAWALRTKLPPG